MQKPTDQSMTNLKRLGRYLKKRTRLVQSFIEQTSTADVVRLSDHAGCLKTRKSTTGMVLLRDAHCLKVSSHTQSTISLSIMDLSNAQPLAWARDPCLQILACVLTSWSALTRRVDWRLAHDEDLDVSGTCRLCTCGCSNEYKRETFA